MKKPNEWLAAFSLFVVLGVVVLASPLPAQAGPDVMVVNPSSQPVPVGIIGTPMVNANVSGNVGIVGTPTVDIRRPEITAGFYFASCTFSGSACQDATMQHAAPGTAFRIDAIEGRTFGTGSANLSAALFLNIVTPGLSTDFAVPCINSLGFALCTATPGIHVTEFNGLTFFTSGAPQGAGRLTVYYTVVNLAP